MSRPVRPGARLLVVSNLVIALCSCHSPGLRGIFTPLPRRSEIARLELNESMDDGRWRLLAETSQEAHIDRFLETVRNVKGVWHPEGIQFGTRYQVVVEDAQQKVIAVYWFDTNRISANVEGRLTTAELRSTANDQIALLAVFGQTPPEWEQEDESPKARGQRLPVNGRSNPDGPVATE